MQFFRSSLKKVFELLKGSKMMSAIFFLFFPSCKSTTSATPAASAAAPVEYEPTKGSGALARPPYSTRAAADAAGVADVVALHDGKNQKK